ncbi:alpha/beta fold hydrolase [Yimella sp. cx-573]|nr:alpha/beta fold hydrolase [Yimella sp. cx-573]
MAQRLHTTTTGTRGPRIAFLHGLFGQGKNWTQIAKALAGDYRPTLIDLPNHGQSPWSDEFSYRAMVLAVANELRAIDPDEPWIVLGHSMGGKVAMLLALEHPELVQRLIVVDISPVDYGGLTSFNDYVEGMLALDLDQVASRADADRLATAWVPEAGTRAFLLQNLRRTDDGWRWQVNLDLLGRSLQLLGGWPTDVDAAPFEGPTLWVAGGDSNYVRPDYAKVMRELFPRVRLVTIKGVGHWPHSQAPEVFLSTIRPFLG